MLTVGLPDRCAPATALVVGVVLGIAWHGQAVWK
jgi:hypothetical protein